jgi:hypothetical protein
MDTYSKVDAVVWKNWEILRRGAEMIRQFCDLRLDVLVQALVGRSRLLQNTVKLIW